MRQLEPQDENNDGSCMKAIALYLHVHQPYRIRHYTALDSGNSHNYFDSPSNAKASNEQILRKVAEKSYIPTNGKLHQLLKENPEFKLSLSLSGTVLEQLEKWAPDALRSFQALTESGRVEILAETYHHSLAFFYSKDEFEMQVKMHREKIESLFGQTPKVFRNTELAYNNELAFWADKAGYKGILAEGWDPVLGWRSPNYVYQPVQTDSIRLLLKNYRLSDDIAFRFGNKDWSEWPMTADKFTGWLNSDEQATNFDLFMDYETFGEHQWQDTGIFEFLEHIPKLWLRTRGNSFATVSELCDQPPVDRVDAPYTVTWADTERDLSAWTGNTMQQQALVALYELQSKILQTNDWALIDDWRRLQTSDHFYYMCTKWWNDGDIHAYFSPYDTPYEAYINFMNAYHDLRFRVAEKGIQV
jgi:alpha-amylase